jgi:hypothetical protein
VPSIIFSSFHGFLEIFGNDDLIALVRKKFLRNAAQGLFILDEQNCFLPARLSR